MGIFKRLIPKQSCMVCAEIGEFCVCLACQASLNTHPNRCVSCASKLGSDLEFCGACLAQSMNFSKAYAAYDYAGVSAQLIKQFKFDNQLCIGSYFAHQLYQLYASITNENQGYDLIIPLPLSRARLQERGYNQTHELLRIIAKKTTTPIDVRAVKRIKATRPLSSLNLKQRKTEIKDAFSAKPMNYQRALLVDDVMTTGSSLNELAKTVIKAGVSTCDVMVLARAELTF